MKGKKRTVSLRQKIWMTITIVFVLTIVIGFGLTFFLYERFYVDHQKEMLLMQGQNLKNVYAQSNDPAYFKSQMNWIEHNSDTHVIYTENAMELSAALPYEGGKDTLISYEERQQLLAGETVVVIRPHPKFDQDILAVALPLLNEDVLTGAIYLYMPLEEVYAPFESIRWILLAFGGVFFIVVLLIGRKVTDQLIRPLKKIEAISERMADGDFSKRIEHVTNDEVGSLSNSFNKLASSLDEVETKRREFLQNVSHELRTPLSYMRGYTEAIVEGVVKKPGDIHKYVEITHRETGRLTRLVQDLLDLAQLEGDSYPMKQEPIPVSQVVYDVTERFTLRLEQKGIELHLDLDEEAIVLGDVDRLEQVVGNIIDNAIRYTNRGGSITVLLEQNEEGTHLTIQDSGRGIPEQDLAFITERFYRVSKSRTREEGGTGLGLAIVQQILNKHGGTLEISSDEGLGTSVVIILPHLGEYT